MQFKRFNGSTWDAIHHKTYDTMTESLTTFPAIIQASGEALTDYTISGNTVQNGTPTPEAPVDVVGCGVRTGNLFDELNFALVQVTSTAYRYGTSLGVLPQGTYTFNATKSAGAQSVYLTAKLNDVYSQTTISSVPFSFTADGDSEYMIRTANNTGTTWEAEKYSDMMLNAGSTALPYEPYGYKLPISVNGTEHPIYLGQIETTRRIKKLVLTGEENWSSYSGVVYLSNVINYLKIDGVVAFCTHYQPQSSIEGVGETVAGHIAFSKSVNFRLCIRDNNYTTGAQFKTYLAQQYAEGTPVTIWYVLAEPETGIVNEPIHKIGDYADTITMAQAGETIPTVDRDNTITFGTTVQPSGMSATFKGWHPVQGAKQYDGSEWR